MQKYVQTKNYKFRIAHINFTWLFLFYMVLMVVTQTNGLTVCGISMAFNEYTLHMIISAMLYLAQFMLLAADDYYADRPKAKKTLKTVAIILFIINLLPGIALNLFSMGTDGAIISNAVITTLLIISFNNKQLNTDQRGVLFNTPRVILNTIKVIVIIFNGPLGQVSNILFLAAMILVISKFIVAALDKNKNKVKRIIIWIPAIVLSAAILGIGNITFPDFGTFLSALFSIVALYIVLIYLSKSKQLWTGPDFKGMVYLVDIVIIVMTIVIYILSYFVEDTTIFIAIIICGIILALMCGAIRKANLYQLKNKLIEMKNKNKQK